MAIDATVTRRSDGGWDFSWSAGTAPYQVWLDGVLLASPATPAYSFNLPGYEDAPPDLEVLSAGDPAQSAEYPPYQVLQWRGIQTAFAYVVQQFLSGTWVTLATIREAALGTYQYETAPQDDATTQEFQVLAVDALGNSGTPLDFSIAVCRNPEHPSVVVETAGTTVVIGAP